MKNLLLTVTLIAAAATSGELLAQATAPRPGPAVKPMAATEDVILGISEGTSGGVNHSVVIAKYADLAERIGKAAGQRVRVEFVREFAQLEEGMKTGRLTYVMARPSDYPGRGLRDYGYRYVASARPEGHCMIYADKQSGVTTLEQAKGRQWVMPETVAYMTRFCRAALRDNGIDLATQNVHHVREQGAVKFYLDHGFAQVGGVASYAGVRKQFEKDGAVLVHKSVPQPYFPLIASSRVTPAQVQAVQSMLVTLEGEAGGRAVLEQIGIDGFDTRTEERMRKLVAWLEGDAKAGKAP
jgi:ABC-type phosphate/phosphonate transport system substrate-binding protein